MNGSSQPLRGLTAQYDGEQLTFEESATGHLSPGMIRHARVPSRLVMDRPLHTATIIEFTDAAGLMWRRLGDGSLQCQRLDSNGSLEWGPKQTPIIETAAPDVWIRPEHFRSQSLSPDDLRFGEGRWEGLGDAQ
jgi:hypothetical protein